MATMRDNSPFGDAIVPTPDPASSDWASTKGGKDIDNGQKETAGLMGTGVTYVGVTDGPSEGTSALDAAAGLLGSQTKKTSPDLC